MSKLKNYPIFLMLSIILHFLSLSTGGTAYFLGQESVSPEESISRKVVHIKLLGIDDGDPSNSAYLRYSETKSEQMANLLSYSKIQFEKDSLFFKKGSAKQGSKVKTEEGELESLDIEESIGPSAKRHTEGAIKIKRSKESLEAEVGQGSFFSQNQSPLFSNTNMNVKVKVPKGFSANQLNQLDLIYTSFISRLSKNFQASFHRNLNSFIFSNPHFPSHIPNYKQELSGLLTYDREGNLMRIQTLRLSDEQMLTDYFMQVLNDVHTIQNLPEPLINDNEQFEVTVNLTLN